MTPDPPPPGPPGEPTAIPPDVLARAVALMNARRYGDRGNWGIDEHGEVVVGHPRRRHTQMRMSALSAVAVAVWCLGMDDPREGADRA